MDHIRELWDNFLLKIQGKRLWGLLMTFVLVIGVAASVTLSQQPQEIRQHASSSGATYEMGIYTSCGTGAGCLANLDTLAQGGFTDVLDYNIWGHNPSLQDFIAYATKAQEDNMKIIWSFKDFWKDKNQFVQEFPAMAATCGCSDNAGFLTYVINSLKTLPSTWGYYIADEASSGNHGYVKTISDIIHNADPAHPRLYVGLAWSTNSVNNVLSMYADTADVLATDYYPIGNSQDINYTKNLAAAVQTVANSTGKQAAMVLQAHSWNHYSHCGLPYPTVDNMVSQMTQTLNYQHPALILWYSQFDILSTSCGEDNPSLHWNNLVTAIHTPQYGACSSSGGDTRSYPQCSRTVGSCLFNFPDKYVVTVHQCNNGTYICPANEARPAGPGECGIPANPSPPPLCNAGENNCTNCVPTIAQNTCGSGTCQVTCQHIALSSGGSCAPQNFTKTISQFVDSCDKSKDYFCDKSTNTCKQAPYGALDGADCTHAYGWTCDVTNYSQPITVHLYLDNPPGAGRTPFAVISANKINPALASECGGNTAHEFDYSLPDSVKDNKPHTLFAYAIDPNNPDGMTNPQLYLSPSKPFICQPGTSGQPPSPEATLAPDVNQTYLVLRVSLPGIGSNAVDSNTNPVHHQRTVSLTLLDANNTVIATQQATLVFDRLSGTFTARVPFTSDVSQVKQIVLTIPQNTPYTLNLSTQLQNQSENVLPTTTLTSGDINNDGKIDVVDYSLLRNCYGGLSSQCSITLYAASDLNDDGIVDGIDYNILLRGMLQE